MNELIDRLREDILRIRHSDSRYGKMADKHLRWEGTANPNGWRLLGDLANDLEQLLEVICGPTGSEIRSNLGRGDEASASGDRAAQPGIVQGDGQPGNQL